MLELVRGFAAVQMSSTARYNDERWWRMVHLAIVRPSLDLLTELEFHEVYVVRTKVVTAPPNC